MKKLLITTGIFPPDIGGPASFSMALGQRMGTKLGLTVLTYSSTLKIKSDKHLPFKVMRVWRKWPWFLRHLIYSFKVFGQMAKHDQVFVLNILNGGLPAMIGKSFFKKKYTVRVVGDRAWEAAINKGKTFFMIDDWQKSRKKGWIGFLFKLQRKICLKADQIIVPSNYLSRIVQGWGVPENKIKVVYNGVDFSPSDLGREEARKKIGIPGNILLSTGRLVAWKGFRMLIKVMPQLLRINQFFRLVIAGDGPEFKVLRAMVKNMGLDKKVYLVGKKSHAELATYLAASEMYILNTGYEGFSHQLLEAMVAGVPVITTAVGGNREIIHQGENGFMIKYNDEFNLVEAIRTVWQTPELQQRFITEGKQAAEYFNVDKMIEETIRTLSL
ncbi:MAG: glycosyltransferase family 4 protein [bacterium]|nr:glycosyltransferase family 4 protein [bacterium]